MGEWDGEVGKNSGGEWDNQEMCRVGQVGEGRRGFVFHPGRHAHTPLVGSQLPFELHLQGHSSLEMPDTLK